MARLKKINHKVTIVHEHPFHVSISKKNPNGITMRDRHLRHLSGTYLDPTEIENVFSNYDRKGLLYPTSDKLEEYKNADIYDDVLAVWTDYFNRKFNTNSPIDPDVIKALIASESGFRSDPPENKIALGIAQITRETFKILQDSKGEAKDFIFSKICQKDLKNPNIAIAHDVLAESVFLLNNRKNNICVPKATKRPIAIAIKPIP